MAATRLTRRDLEGMVIPEDSNLYLQIRNPSLHLMSYGTTFLHQFADNSDGELKSRKARCEFVKLENAKTNRWQNMQLLRGIALGCKSAPSYRI